MSIRKKRPIYRPAAARDFQEKSPSDRLSGEVHGSCIFYFRDLRQCVWETVRLHFSRFDTACFVSAANICIVVILSRTASR
jgi:hypothetical protein